MVRRLRRPAPRNPLVFNNLQQNKKKFDTAHFTCYLMGMTKSEIESHISTLHVYLQTADLSEADRVSLRNEIGYWEDKLALLEFRQENADIDFGYHSEWE